ncbi:MAG: TolC family protein [Gemmatimonadales bacterium]|nr:TolC family protein [Gemmatimonadales bacterium]
MLALLLALQAVVPPDSALPRVTLQEALQRAAQLDPDYVQALGQVDNAVWARRNAFAVFILPSVNLTLNGQRSNPPGFSAVPIPEVWFGQISARYDLFTGGQKFAELTRSAVALEGAHAGELAQRFATALLTESDYYNVLAGTELDRVARERLRRAREQLAVARARVISGAAVSTDSLNLRLELTRAQVGALQQQSALRIARLELGRRVGADGPVDAAPLDTAAILELPITLADAITQAARQGPQYRIAAANERAARASYRAQLGTYLPRVTLTFNANAFDTEFFPSAFKQTNWGLTISLPLWDNGQRELTLSRARVNRDVARAVRADMDRAVQHDVTAAYDQYVTARATTALAAEGVVVARESFRVQQTRYSAGATTILDLLEAQVNLSAAEAQLVQAQYAARLALAGLESILGRRLFTDKDTP